MGVYRPYRTAETRVIEENPMYNETLVVDLMAVFVTKEGMMFA